MNNDRLDRIVNILITVWGIAFIVFFLWEMGR